MPIITMCYNLEILIVNSTIIVWSCCYKRKKGQYDKTKLQKH